MATDRDLSLDDACVTELPFPERKRGAEAGWVLTNADEDSQGSCEPLAHATEASRAKWGDWVVHLGPDGILNQRAARGACARARESRLSGASSSRAPRARRLAQGSVMPGITRTANDPRGACPRWARGRRRWRRLCAPAKPPEPRTSPTVAASTGRARRARGPGACLWCRTSKSGWCRLGVAPHAGLEHIVALR